MKIVLVIAAIGTTLAFQGWKSRIQGGDLLLYPRTASHGPIVLVDSRPELRQFVALFQREYEEVLTVRPGITDLASLKYRDEAGPWIRRKTRK